MPQHHKNRTEQFPSIAEQVKSWRVHQGLRQGELEERAGLSHNAISRIETGKVCPKLETIESLAVAMELSVEHLQFKRPSSQPDKISSDLDMVMLVDRLKSVEPEKRRRLLTTFMELVELADGES